MSNQSPKQSIIAIDPGVKGAIAIWYPDRIEAKPLPIIGSKKKELDIATLAQWIAEAQPSLAVVEKAAARPGQGVCSMFSFGKGYGSILGVLAALQIPVELVTPQTWKKVILAGTKRDKDSAIQYCRQRFPTVPLVPSGCKKESDGMSDSLCILDFCLRSRGLI
jgi:crossover junction endodeoxyribonuclease RuvC